MRKQEICEVLCELYNITGFRASLHDTSFNEIASYPESHLPFCDALHASKSEYERCRECDRAAFEEVLRTKDTVIYRCRYGLTEAISPLYNFGVLTGFLMMGQTRSDATNDGVLTDALERVGIPLSEATKTVDSLPRVSPSLTRSYVKIMTICAQYLTLSNAMQKPSPSIAESAMMYIHDNFDKKITLKDICSAVGCSKSSLLMAFKKEFGITVNDAITRERLTLAKKLLADRSISINEISQLTGFYDQSYFSKVFSREFGTSPSEYRRENL